jgi:hypothetical protein
MHLFIVALMPALGSNAAALSILQPRAISNLGTSPAMAMTSCEVRAIIENEINIFSSSELIFIRSRGKIDLSNSVVHCEGTTSFLQAIARSGPTWKPSHAERKRSIDQRDNKSRTQVRCVGYTQILRIFGQPPKIRRSWSRCTPQPP